MAEGYTDLFRFFVHRGVQQSTAQPTRRWVVPAYPDGLPTADRQLIQGRGYYTYRRSSEYRDTLASALLTGLDAALREVVPHETAQQLSERISRAIRTPDLGGFVASTVFASWWARAARGLLVSMYDPTQPLEDAERATFARQLQMLAMLRRLVAGDLADAAQAHDFLIYAIVVLPRDAFAQDDAETGTDIAESAQEPGLDKEREAGPSAPQEIDPVAVASAIAEVRHAVGLVARTGESPHPRAAAHEPFVLSNVPESYLSDRARSVIAEVVPHSDRLSLPDIAHALESSVGAQLQPAAAQPVVQAQAMTMGGPVGSTTGLSRVPGVADLKVVRNRLLRYEDGEIALIENVMAKESRKRRHRLLHRDTDVTSTTTESEKVTERDTQVAEQFALEQESSNTVSSDSKVEAGLSVTASYGSFVSVTANAGFSSSTAQTHSDRASSKYARDVVDRSASKVRDLVQTFQSRISLTEMEETNTHGFHNETDEHVVGIYRWVNKIVEAQTFNYGKRLMLEMMVPDPARYYRQRLGTRALPGVTRTPPAPFEVADNSRPTKVRPLEPTDIGPANYLAFAALYGAADVEPPPPLYKWISDAWKEGKGEDPWAAMSARKEIEIDEGYIPTFFRAALVYPQRGIMVKPDPNSTDVVIVQDPITAAVISVGGNRQNLGQGGGVVTGALLTSVQTYPADKVGVAVMVERQTSYTCEMAVLCTRADEEYRRWQTTTYGSLLRAFENRRSEYETQVKTAQSEQEQTFATRPAAENEATIRTELKRAALTLLQQRQPPFLNDAIGVDRPPTIDLAASQIGAPLQFFEQACEWPQLVYLPYGYYWANPGNWDELSDQWDGDEQMRAFLGAGWARVVIPVRPAFTSAMCLYLSTGIIWNGDQVPQVDDPLYVSAVQEIQEADDIADGVPDGPPWTVTLPTALTHLQQGPDLPVLAQP